MLKVGVLAVPRWWRDCGAFEAQSILGVFDENTWEERWSGPKGRHGSRMVGWNKKKMVAQLEIREVIKVKSVRPKFL